MIIVLDNIIFWLQKAGGISVVWYELLIRITKEKEAEVFFVNQPTASNNIFFQFNLRNVIVDSKSWINRIRQPKIYFDKKFIFHSSYYRYCKSKNAINITTVHDFTHEYYFKGLKAKLNYYLKKRALKNSQGIICISENTKMDMLKIHPWTKNIPIKVIYNGVSEDFYCLADPFHKMQNFYPFINCNKKYLLYVGSRTHYKSFDKVVKALAILEDDFELLIVGSVLTTDEKSFLDQLVPKRYHVFHNISNDILNIIYNISYCLLYSSIYEGFGIPILEAMKAGCPTISVATSSIPEVVGDAGIQVNSPDAKLFADAVKTLENIEERSKLIEKGILNAKKFSWQKNFDEVMSFYKEVSATFAK